MFGSRIQAFGEFFFLNCMQNIRTCWKWAELRFNHCVRNVSVTSSELHVPRSTIHPPIQSRSPCHIFRYLQLLQRNSTSKCQALEKLEDFETVLYMVDATRSSFT